MKHCFTVLAEEEKQRLDLFVLSKFPSLTRSHIKNQIENGNITVNEKVVKAGAILKASDRVCVLEAAPKQIDLTPENIPLDIVFEDEHLMVLNKQAGLVVHPGGGSYSGTLVNALLFHATNLSGINGEVRPGIVHRLDKETSGLMLVAKTDLAHVSLSKQIALKTCKRTYWAICDGVIPYDAKTISTHLGRHPKHRKIMAVLPQGKVAITELTVLKRFKQNTLCQFVLQTGRTHQIRVHAKHIGFPVTNDVVYGMPNKHVQSEGQLLHSHSISFTHPVSKCELHFEASPPQAFMAFLSILEKQ